MRLVRVMHLIHGKYSTGGEITHYLLDGEGKKCPSRKTHTTHKCP